MKRFLQFTYVVTALWASAALAQPDLKNAPKADNPPNRNVLRQAQLNKALKADLQARNTKRAEVRLERLPKALTLLGVTDEKTQGIIVAHFNAVMTAREPVTTAQMQLRRALIIKATTDTQIKSATEAQRTARKNYEVAFQKALDDLDAKIAYRKSPRLEAALLAVGALDADGVNSMF